jgi:hypothetical protein
LHGKPTSKLWAVGIKSAKLYAGPFGTIIQKTQVNGIAPGQVLGLTWGKAG